MSGRTMSCRILCQIDRPTVPTAVTSVDSRIRMIVCEDGVWLTVEEFPDFLAHVSVTRADLEALLAAYPTDAP